MDEIVLKVEGRSNEKNPFQEGETGKFEPPSFHEVKSFVSGISPSRLWITGGEPTMRNDLPAIIRVSGNFRHDVVVVTNGRRFSYLSYAETIASCGAKTFFVNLYSVEPEIHNALAGGDFFRQAADGIENLKKAGADVIVSCLVSKANIAGLGGVASFCSENGLGLHLIPARAAVENQKRLIPALKEVAGAVSSALRSALASGMDRNRLSYEQLPCCMMEEFKGLERAAIASRVHFPADGGAYSKPKPFPCLDCAILDGCPVAPAGYISAHGAFGLNPVGRHYSRDLAFRYKAAHPRFDPETCSRGSGAAYFDPSHALIDRGGADFDLFELSGKGELFESLYVKNAHGFMLEPQADSEESGVLYIHTACRKCLRLHRCAGVFSRFFGPDDEAAGPDSSWRKKAGYRPEKDKAAGFSRTAAFNPAYIEDAGKWLEQLLAETPCGETFSIQARFPAALLGEARHLKDELLLLPWKAVDMLKGGSVRLHSYDISPVRNGGKWTLTFEKTDGPPPEWYYERLGTLFILSECPSRCVMCNVRTFYSDKITPIPVVFRIIEEFRLCGYTRIDYFGGEPTIRDDLPDIIYFATTLGCYSDIITNAIPVTGEFAGRLANAGLSLAMVSLDAPDGELHDRIRGLKGAFDQAIMGIKEIIARPEIEVNIDTVILPQSYKVMHKQVELAGRLGATHVNFFFCVCGPISAHKPMWLNRDQMMEFHREILPEIKKIAADYNITFTLSPDIPDGDPEKYIERISTGLYNPFFDAPESCAAPLDEIYVTLEGDVFPCTSPTIIETKYIVGNIFEKPLIEILNDAPMKEFSKLAGHADACRMCWRCHLEPRIEKRFEDAG